MKKLKGRTTKFIFGVLPMSFSLIIASNLGINGAIDAIMAYKFLLHVIVAV